MDNYTSRYRNTALNSGVQYVKSGSATFFGCTVINPNAVPVYLKLYNKDGTPTQAVDNSTMVYFVPVSGQFTVTQSTPIKLFESGLYVNCVTGLGDTFGSGPSTSVYAEVAYK